jgi:GNAT superfamily N-acetyltransferase
VPCKENGLTLPALLSKALLAFAIEFEREAEVSLAISANVLRLIGDGAVAVLEFPRLAGISKEAVATALKFLEQRGYAAVESEPGSRAKRVVLTARGRSARELYQRLVCEIEKRWRSRFGERAVDRLRQSLEQLAASLGRRRYCEACGHTPTDGERPSARSNSYRTIR